jgi:wobble nucleotide-excising tRNase
MNENFDNTKPNVVLVTDVTETYGLSKSFGVYKVAYELRSAGYQVFVLQHAHVFSVEEIFKNLRTFFVKL